jgi:hypothetical protein
MADGRGGPLGRLGEFRVRLKTGAEWVARSLLCDDFRKALDLSAAMWSRPEEAIARAAYADMLRQTIARGIPQRCPRCWLESPVEESGRRGDAREPCLRFGQRLLGAC